MTSRAKAANHQLSVLNRSSSEIFMGNSFENTSNGVLYLGSCRLETNFAKKGLNMGIS